MLVLSMNSKRQRRPNVRLGEIGDASAAFARSISQKTKETLVPRRWKQNFVYPKESAYSHVSPRRSSEFMVSDPGLSPIISADMQNNRENKNPNSSKSLLEFASSDEIDVGKSKLNFGTVTRKCRLMKRPRRSTEGNWNVFGGSWNSRISPDISSDDEKECGRKELVGFESDPCFNLYNVNGYKDSDHETPAMSKDACENDIEEPTFNTQTRGNSTEFPREGACYEGYNFFSQSSRRDDVIEVGGSDVNGVRRWLEELGFGKYASVFEMHEVDEEALPLLTFEDLKEMGVLPVGPRRRLYTAIRQLRQDRERVSA